MATRITLTAKQLETEGGKALLDYLWWLAEDGYVSDEEINHMSGWLAQASHIPDVTGIHYLKELVDAVLLDGFIEEGERAEIHRAILRILPKDYRAAAKQQKDNLDAAYKAREDLQGRKTEALATEKQISYLISLGGQPYEGMTKREASEAITSLTDRDGPTVRQKMVLRFWNRLDMLSCSVDEVSYWMDDFYRQDERHLDAWELWKYENGDRGGRSIDQIDTVPIGAGFEYLQKVSSGNSITNAVSKVTSFAGKAIKMILYGFFGFVVLIIGILILLAIFD